MEGLDQHLPVGLGPKPVHQMKLQKKGGSIPNRILLVLLVDNRA